MDELDLFRGFRRGVATPSEDAQRHASALLARAIGREATPRSGVLRLLGKRRFSVLALAALVGATATALFVSTPWKSSPGFLERAQAALTPPADTILHMKWRLTLTSVADPACPLTRHPSEIWIDQTPPHRYRIITVSASANKSGSDPAYSPVRPCSDKRFFDYVRHARRPTEPVTPGPLDWHFPIWGEIGGDLDSGPQLWFVPPDTLAVAQPDMVGRQPDPVKELRDAISAGRAHQEGKTQLDGRRVERIRIDNPAPDCPDPPVSCREPSYAYVDPETFFLVQLQSRIALHAPDGSVERFDVVRRFVTFEYLPRTAANLALTDIRAQHPNIDP